MKRIVTLCTIAILTATSLAAQPLTLPSQWSAAEKAELQKIGRLRGDLGTSRVNLADVVRDNSTEANRAAVSAALIAEADASHECFQAVRHVFNLAPSNSTPVAIFPPFGTASREELVTRGVNYARACGTKADDLANKLLAITATQDATAKQLTNISRIHGSANQIKTTLSQTNIVNFQALPFTEWRPAPHPMIVPSHGDFDAGYENLAVGDFRMLRATRIAVEFYKKESSWPEYTAPMDCGGELSSFGFRELLRYGGSYSLLLSRALMIGGGASSPTDESVILGDAAASSGMRPPSFHAISRIMELNSNPDGTGVRQNFRGRNLEGGANGQFEVILDGHSLMVSGYIRYLNCLADAGTITQEAALNKARAAFHMPAGPTQWPNIPVMGSGWLRHVELDFAFGWEGSQGYDHYVFAFIHALAPPPCDPGTHPVNGRCQPDTPGGGFTCGAGTQPQGTECIADPCPECPPPPVCPSFVPVADPREDGVLPVRCIEQ